MKNVSLIDVVKKITGAEFRIYKFSVAQGVPVLQMIFESVIIFTIEFIALLHSLFTLTIN